MTQQTKQIPVSSIILDEDIYPRKGIDHRRVGIFAENIRDGFAFGPIEVAPCPDKPGFSRLLDGAHRWRAYKSTGVEEVKVVIKDLDGNDPLLYAATKAIGPKQLTEDEARDTARRAYTGNASLSSSDIGKAIGRSRQTVDLYLSDLRAANRIGLDIKIFRLNRLGIPQDRIAKRLGLDQKTIHNHLGEMPALAFLLNSDLSRGFTIAQVSQKHGWTDPMAGGGVTPDTCLAMGRRCRAFDLMDRPETRPEIEPFTWDISSDQGLFWPVSAKGKPDLIIFDPPCFDKKAADYDKKSISGLSKKVYLEFDPTPINWKPI